MRLRLSSTALFALAALAAPMARAAGPLNPHDLALLNRVTWGQSASSAADLQALGARAWLDRQLRPQPGDRAPAAVQAQIDALPIASTPMADLVVRVDAQIKAANKLTDPDQKKAAQQAYQQGLTELGREAATRELLRDVYSPDQLQEQMTWFWLNHFNIHMYTRDVRAMIGDYEDRAIRPRSLGRFRDLLEATLKHPAMLRYLDNDQNATNHINENYAREIMELHTMGVGSGYSQKDVQELARILTGVGVDLSPDAPKLKPAYQPLLVREGLFEFNPNRHDFGDKLFLGHAIKGSGFGEVEQALDILAREPATAHHVCAQMAAYFMGDDPPPALVDRCAAKFTSTAGDIRETMRCIVTSPEFFSRTAYRAKVKTPFELVVSTMRAMAAAPDTSARTAQAIAQLGQPIYGRLTPDGWPDRGDAWMNSGAILNRINFGFRVAGGQIPGVRVASWPAAVRLRTLPAGGQVDGVVDELLGGDVSADTRRILVSGENPMLASAPAPKAPTPTLTGLPAIVALALGSPEFQRR